MSMKTKIGYGNKADIDTAISSSKLDEGDIVVTKDTDELCFINPDKAKLFIKSRTSKEYTLNGTDLGALKNGDSIPADTSIDDLLNMITQKAISPTYTQPSVSIAKSGDGTASGSYESGTSITPIITATFNKNDAGDITKLSILKGSSEVGSDVASSYTYNGEAFIIGDETITYSAKATYGDGPVKNNNLGNQILQDRLRQVLKQVLISHTPVPEICSIALVWATFQKSHLIIYVFYPIKS